MINLLPPQEKRAQAADTNTKLVLVFGAVAITSLLSFGLVLLAVKFYILENINYHQFMLDGMKKNYETADFLSYREIIDKHNSLIAGVNAFYASEGSFANALKLLASLERPKGLYVTDLNAEHVTATNRIKVSVKGFSAERDGLLRFKDVIEKNPRIMAAYFPPENWIKANNLVFSLTFETNDR